MAIDKKTQELKILVLNEKVKQAKSGLYTDAQIDKLEASLRQLTVNEVQLLSELSEQEKSYLIQQRVNNLIN